MYANSGQVLESTFFGQEWPQETFTFYWLQMIIPNYNLGKVEHF